MNNDQKGSLAKKLVRVMDDCAYVQKDAMNEHHKYAYASAAAVLVKVNESLVKHGIATVSKSKVTNSWERITGKGATENYREVEVEITLIDVESGEERVIHGIGCGMDQGDKAVMKAQTAAVKYAWMMALQISTGDDPEADQPEPEENGTNTTQQDGVPIYRVEEITPANDRAKVALCEVHSGEYFEAVVKQAYGLFRAQQIEKGSRITCEFGDYKAPTGREYKEILAPRRIA